MMRITTKNLLCCIRNADAGTVSDLLPAIIQRYSEVFQDWEIMAVVMPRSDIDAQIRTLQNAITFLTRIKEQGDEKGSS